MNVSLFIKSYESDFPWLAYALRSCDTFASGFREIVLAIPEGEEFQREGVRTVHIREPKDCDHYLFQEVAKLYADTFTDAEFILFTDSDTIFTRPVTPETYFTEGRVNWMITPYAKTDTPWQPMIEKFLGRPVEFETMRRHPQCVPRWLLAKLRAFCEQQHGMTLDKYVMSQPYREFSEFNALGAFAYYFHHDKFNWINTEEVPAEQWPALTVLQKYSHDGLTPEIEAEFESILRPASEFVSLEPITISHANGDPIFAQIDDAQDLASRLKTLCSTNAETRRIRRILHDAGVIKLDYLYRKRKGWKRKAKK